MISPVSTMSRRERGSALVLALMVALILALLGLGLLLQSSIGLKGSGTDRWVTKAVYAADAGITMQAHLLTQGRAEAPAAFELDDDPGLEGKLSGSYQVEVTELCEVEDPAPVPPSPDGRLVFEYPRFSMRSWRVRSRSQRHLGAGVVSSAEVEAEVTVWPADRRDQVLFQPPMCR
jgi:hypothetical protein